MGFELSKKLYICEVMGLYNIAIKPFVRKMNIERASKVALRYFEIIEKIPLGRAISRLVHNNRPSGLQREVFGIQFYNPIGLGAGLDLYGELYNDLNGLGFSFVEIGPMGIDGVRRAVKQLQKDPQKDILAACINSDYLTAFALFYDFVDFFVIDISADPGTEVLDPILEARLAEDVYKPIVVKLPRSITTLQMDEILDYSQLYRIDGIEARNMDQLRHIVSYTQGRLPVIANMHIETTAQAVEAMDAGASLVAVRNGLVRNGPKFVADIQKVLLNKKKNERAAAKPDRVPAEG